MRLSKTELWAIATAIVLVAFISMLGGKVGNTPQTGDTAHHTKSQAHVWTKADSLAYAHDRVLANAEAQFSCLSNLWGKESAWEAKAHNPIRVMGKTAGGIPQLLGMSPLIPPTQQIDRGLGYVYYRYGTVCKAWDFWRKHGWY